MLKSLFSFLQIALLIFISLGPAAAMQREPEVPQAGKQPHIVVSTRTRVLYFFDANSNVRTFSIAVGREGRKWSGETVITRKVRNPRWAPPPAVRKDNPGLPKIVEPGPNNPLGVAVLVLGDGTYGIHGNNDASKVGTSVSYGCFRMYNSDILYLFEQVAVGTPVTVMR